MKRKGRCLFATVIWLTFGQSPAMAIDCGERMTRIDVVGIIHDARSHGIAEETLSVLSEDDRVVLYGASEGGPYLVVVEEGTNKIRALFVQHPETPDEAVQLVGAAQMIGRRVKVTGCASAWDASTISIDNLNDVELLE